jgi:hypothetical protein
MNKGPRAINIKGKLEVIIWLLKGEGIYDFRCFGLGQEYRSTVSVNGENIKKKV